MTIPDFDLLADKVSRLAEQTHALRSENASLRNEMAILAARNQDMQQRMLQAQTRISNLLAKLPPEVVNEEAV